MLCNLLVIPLLYIYIYMMCHPLIEGHKGLDLCKVPIKVILSIFSFLLVMELYKSKIEWKLAIRNHVRKYIPWAGREVIVRNKRVRCLDQVSGQSSNLIFRRCRRFCYYFGLKARGKKKRMQQMSGCCCLSNRMMNNQSPFNSHLLLRL
jgi:hypothetical protein